jgi:hypothetical protein
MPGPWFDNRLYQTLALMPSKYVLSKCGSDLHLSWRCLLDHEVLHFPDFAVPSEPHVVLTAPSPIVEPVNQCSASGRVEVEVVSFTCGGPPEDLKDLNKEPTPKERVYPDRAWLTPGNFLRLRDRNPSLLHIA